LKQDKCPTVSETETWRQRGLVVEKECGKDIQFSPDWNAGDIDRWLCGLFPKVFQWLDAYLGSQTEGSFHWVLLQKEQRKLIVLERPEMSGKDLILAWGPVGRKYLEYTIRIGE